MGVKKGTSHKKLHFNLHAKNLITKEWVLMGQYPTIKSMSTVLGYSYGIVQNIRLGRHKMLCNFYKISKLETLTIKKT